MVQVVKAVEPQKILAEVVAQLKFTRVSGGFFSFPHVVYMCPPQSADNRTVQNFGIIP